MCFVFYDISDKRIHLTFDIRKRKKGIEVHNDRTMMKWTEAEGCFAWRIEGAVSLFNFNFFDILAC